jgi:predicted secreted protein
MFLYVIFLIYPLYIHTIFFRIFFFFFFFHSPQLNNILTSKQTSEQSYRVTKTKQQSKALPKIFREAKEILQETTQLQLSNLHINRNYTKNSQPTLPKKNSIYSQTKQPTRNFKAKTALPKPPETNSALQPAISARC